MGIDVSWSDEVLDVHVRGLDRVLGLRRRLEVPLSRVLDVRALPRGIAESDALMPGTGFGLPGVLAIGYFRGRTGRRQWWRVHRARQVLVVDLSFDSELDRLVLAVADPDATAAAVAASVQRYRSVRGAF